MCAFSSASPGVQCGSRPETTLSALGAYKRIAPAIRYTPARTEPDERDRTHGRHIVRWLNATRECVAGVESGVRQEAVGREAAAVAEAPEAPGLEGVGRGA